MKFLNDLNINENSLKNGRFEEVSSLPSTNLFVGRQVVYNNKIYIYTDSGWISTSQIKYKTTKEWETENPILLKGEIGYDSTSKRYKIGNGTTAWNKLKYDIDLGVLSSGQQLVVNGNGILGDNTNFSQLVYDPTMSFNGSPGVFKQSADGVYSGIIESDLFIPIDTTKKYRMSIDIANIPYTVYTRNYMFLTFYDIDKYLIRTEHNMYFQGSTTTLARDLKVGDTEIYVTDLSGFTQKSQSYQRAIIFWDYKNSYGYQYPKETYSRYYNSNLWTNEEQLDYTNNKIILDSPWSGKEHLAGCDISQNNAGGTYKYLKTEYMNSLVHWISVIGEVDYSGQNVSGKFSPGIAYVKVAFLLNYSKNPNGRVAISNIRLEEITEDLRYPLTLFNRTYNGTTSLTIAPSDVVGAMDDGSADITDNTEFITSNVNGFNYSGSVNVPYRRKATYIWNWIKSKLNFNIIKGKANRGQIEYGDLWTTDMSNPFDNSKIKELNESCLKNIPLNAVNFYVSFDEGENWIDFFTLRPDITKSQVIGFVFNNSKDGKSFVLDSSFNDDRNKWLRIEITFGGYAHIDYIYSLITYCSYNGIGNPMLHVFGFKNSNYTNGSITINEGWTEILKKRFVGWSGWNSYYLPRYIFGSSSGSHFSKMAIEFRGEGFSNSNYKYGSEVLRLFMFAKTIYSPFRDNKSDIYLHYDGTMEFPNKTISKGYSIKNGTASQLLLANGSTNTLKTIGGNTLLGTGDIAFKTINNQVLIGNGNISIEEDSHDVALNDINEDGLEWYLVPVCDDNVGIDNSNTTYLYAKNSTQPDENRFLYNRELNAILCNIYASDANTSIIDVTENKSIDFRSIVGMLCREGITHIYSLDDFQNWLITLNGSNTTPTKSISTMISEGIAKVVANAPASFDTLKEIADWISTHQNDASAMNTAINTNTTNITNLTTKVNTNTTNISANATQISGIKGDITSINSIIQSLTNEINTLKTELQNAKAEIAYLKSVAPVVTAENGFYVVDEYGYIGFKVDNNGATDSATTIETTNLDE